MCIQGEFSVSFCCFNTPEQALLCVYTCMHVGICVPLCVSVCVCLHVCVSCVCMYMSVCVYVNYTKIQPSSHVEPLQ